MQYLQKSEGGFKGRFFKELKEVDVDRNWDKLLEKLDWKQSVSGSTPVFLSSSRFLSRIAAVALILLLSGVTLFLVKKSPGNHIQQVSSIQEITEVVLSDGSIIELNRGSTFSYPEQLNRRRREVTLSGEAFFDVADLNKVPFYVYMGNATVRVLGTSFHIKEDKEQIILCVITGEVLFYQTDSVKKAIRLAPGEKAIFHTTTGRMEQDTFESHNFLFWKTAELTYRDEPLETVFRELEAYFNTPIVVEDREILQDRVTTSCQGQQLGEILNELSFLHNLHYIRKSDTIYVHKQGQ